MLMLFCCAGLEWCDAHFTASAGQPFCQFFVAREEDA